MRIWLTCIIGLFLADKALACGKAELQTLKELAQSLSPRTEGVGQPLLGCPLETAEAAQWLAFYRDVSGIAPKPPLPREAAVRTNASGDVGKAIALAYAGAFEDLKSKLDSGDPKYAEEPATFLAVGRMLVRSHRFADGRRYFQSFLRLREASWAEQAEYLYLPIWEGDLDHAEHDLTGVRIDGTPADFRSAVDRARSLLATLRVTRSASGAGAGAAAGPARDVLVTGSVEAFTIKDEMRRLTSTVLYTGVVAARWQHHLIDSEVYDRASLNTDELWVGKDATIGKVIASGHLGYMTHGDSHYFGDASLGVKLPRNFTVSVGADRRALYTVVPLTEPALGLQQDRGYVEGDWAHRVTWRSMLLRDGSLPEFERHELGLRQPLGAAAADGDGVNLLARLAYQARNRPSPDYESFRRIQQLGLGASFLRRVGSQWDAGGSLVYVLLQRQPFGAESFLTQSGVDAQVEVGTLVGDALRLTGKAVFAAQETDQPSEPVEQRVSVIAALELLR